MVTIAVPKPGPTAFRKSRPLSDLIKAQVKHFQHIESKLPRELQGKFAPHQITTEAAAAEYIAHMTRLLTDRAAQLERPGPVLVPAPAAPTQPGVVPAIAAKAAEIASAADTIAAAAGQIAAEAGSASGPASVAPLATKKKSGPRKPRAKKS